MNPYWGSDIFACIILFIKRIGLALSGKLPISDIAIDEIQLSCLILVSLSSCLLSPFLILKRKTMMANSLSHTTLLGLIISYLAFNLCLPNPSCYGIFHPLVLVSAALISAFLTTFLTDLLHKSCKLQEEASVALSFTFLFAVGLILVSLYTKKIHIGIEVIMGNIDAVSLNDLLTCLITAGANLLMIALLYNYYAIFAFDAVLAYSMKAKPRCIHYLLMIQTSLSAFAAFRVVGVFLFLIFLTSPFLAARLLAHGLKKILALSCLLSFFACIFGVAISRHLLSCYDLPISTGALTAMCVASLYPITRLYVVIKNRSYEIRIRKKERLSEG